MAEIDLIDEDPIATGTVGRIAEQQFQLWCSQVDMIANAVRQDVTGWDFLVEYRGQPTAWRADQMTIKAQVKGTGSEAGSVQIKLDNFARMSSDPHPWVLIGVSISDREVVGARVLHVDEQIVARIFERVRGTRPGAPLHRHHVRITWAPEHEVEATAKAVGARIREIAGISMWDYIDRKRRWQPASQLARYIHGTMSIDASTPEEAWDMLADLATGTVDRVPVRAVRAAGVSLPEQIGDGEGYIAITGEIPSIGSAALELVAGSESTVLHCKIFGSWIPFNWLPPAAWKMRFANPYLSLVARQGSEQMSWHLQPPTSPARLAEIGATGRAILIMSQPNARISLSVDDIEQRAEFGAVTIDSEVRQGWPDDVMHFGGAAADALWLAGFVGLDVDMIVSPGSIAAQAQQFALLRGLLDVRFPVPQVVLRGTDAQNVDGQGGAIVVCPGVLLGERVICACIAQVGILGQAAGSKDVTVVSAQRRVMEILSVRLADWKPGLDRDCIDRAVVVLEGEGLTVGRM